MSHDQSLLEEFVAEAKEHLSDVEEGLLALEQTSASPDQEVIARIFRAIHSIKGAAGFLGLTKVNELSHVMETLLDMMRSGDINPESQYVDALLNGLDHLSTMIDDIGHSNEMDIQAVHNQLASMVGKATSPKVKKELETRFSLEDAQGSSVDMEINEFQLKGLAPQNEELYVLKFDLSELGRKGGMSPVALVRELLTTGQIVDAKLETPAENLDADLSASPLYYKILYSTIMERTLVQLTTGLPDDQIIDVQLEKLQKESQAKESLAAPEKAAPQQAPEDVPESQVKAPAVEEAKETPTGKKGNREFGDTIRIQVDVLDRLMALAGELVLVRNQQLLNLNSQDAVARGIAQRLDIVTTELQESVMRTRMQPIGNVFSKLTRIVRDLSRKLGKQIDISLTGNEVELDKTILEALADPLVHLIRNCCDHGIEIPAQRSAAGKPATGLISVQAYHEAGQINIKIIDDGKGISPEALKKKAIENQLKTESELAVMTDKEIISLILLPGFSMAKEVTDVSGRGVGMDVVKTSIEQYGGTLELDSQPGRGATVHLRLPLTLAIIPCLIVIVGKQRYAIPQVNLEELVCLYDEQVRDSIEVANGQEIYRLRDHLLPMVRLNEVLQRPNPFSEIVRSEISEYHYNGRTSAEAAKKAQDSLTFAVVKIGMGRLGLIVDKVIGTEEIVVQPMHPTLKKLGIYTGATVMGDGVVALILDIEGIARHVDVGSFMDASTGKEEGSKQSRQEVQNVLLFKNGAQEQFAVSLPLIRRIENINVSQFEKVGDKEFVTIDDVATRIVHLDHVLNVSPPPDQESYFLLLPKHARRPFGILISKLLEVTETSLALDDESHMQDGLLGTGLVKDKITLFLDIFRLIELAEPEWYATQAKKISQADKKKILLVEDTPFFLRLVKGYLESAHYDVLTAINGKEALEILRSNPVDVIVSDIEMPIMDGWTFLRQVRNDPALMAIPAMALTALSSEEDRKKAAEAGFNKYEVKIDREKLLSTVSQIIGESETEKTADDPSL